MNIPFEVGRTYNRKQDIHSQYGGQGQGGISTPHGPFIFLFTGESGDQYGYKDGWTADGVYLYTGEGQVGDMQFIRGNKAIRDHIQNGKDLFLFEILPKRKGCRFINVFSCESWEYRRAPDKNGDGREVIDLPPIVVPLPTRVLEPWTKGEAERSPEATVSGL